MNRPVTEYVFFGLLILAVLVYVTHPIANGLDTMFSQLTHAVRP